MYKVLTISIVTYNAGEDIIQCLNSLRAQTSQLFDIIIVDNASSDGTTEKVAKQFPECKIIKQTKNLGFGRAHNLAISSIKTPWVLVLNQDVVLEPNALEKLLEACDLKTVGAIGPKLLRKKGSDEIDTAGIQKSFYFKYSEKLHIENPEVWGISGACALYNMKALESIAYNENEYFDKHFFMYKEDVDLAERLNKKGWSARIVSDAVGYHDRTGAKSVTRKERAIYIKENSYRNHFYLLIKHVTLLQLPIVLFYELGKFLYLVITDPKILRIIPSVIKHLPIMVKRRYV